VHHTRVLVVEAHAEVRAALAQVVERDPSLWLVGLASDFRGALEHAIREQPDVAIVGFKLHGGGPRLVREMRASCPNTRVVAFSVYEDRSAVFELLQAGAIAYLVKGADAADIVRAVDRATAGESTLSESVTSDVLHELADHLNRSRTSEDVRRRRVAQVRQATQPGPSRPSTSPSSSSRPDARSASRRCPASISSPGSPPPRGLLMRPP